jgi:hypothetical protein
MAGDAMAGNSCDHVVGIATGVEIYHFAPRIEITR